MMNHDLQHKNTSNCDNNCAMSGKEFLPSPFLPIRDQNDNNDDGRRIHGGNMLSSFMTNLLDEVSEKWQPAGIDTSPTATTARNTFPISQKLATRQSRLLPISSYNHCYNQTTARNLSVVADNAKIPSSPLRRRNAALHNAVKDDRREMSASSIESDDVSGTDIQGREAVEDNCNDSEEIVTHSSLATILRKSHSSVDLRRHIFEAKSDIMKLRDDQPCRWSPDGLSQSSRQKHGACEPKRYIRRPSL